MFFKGFDRIYVVHLPDAGRRARMQAQLDRFGVSATFVHAKQPPATFTMSNMRRNPRMEFGCSLSHIAAIVEAIADRAEQPLFLEDDVVFAADTRERIETVWTPLPKWDVLYLGGHPREKAERISEHLVKVGKFSCAEAYAVRGYKLPEFHQFWCDRVSQPNAMFDFILGEFAAANTAYCFYPCLTEQPPGMSHISGAIDDKRDLVRRGWANNLA